MILDTVSNLTTIRTQAYTCLVASGNHDPPGFHNTVFRLQTWDFSENHSIFYRLDFSILRLQLENALIQRVIQLVPGIEPGSFDGKLCNVSVRFRLLFFQQLQLVLFLLHTFPSLFGCQIGLHVHHRQGDQDHHQETVQNGKPQS